MKEKIEILPVGENLESRQRQRLAALLKQTKGPVWSNKELYEIEVGGEKINLQLKNHIVKRHSTKVNGNDQFRYDVASLKKEDSVGGGFQGSCFTSSVCYKFENNQLVQKDKPRIVKYSKYDKLLSVGAQQKQLDYEYSHAKQVGEKFPLYNLHVKPPVYTEDSMFLTMRKITGCDLFDLVYDEIEEKCSPVSLRIRLRISLGILANVLACFESNVLHRDIKPENFIVNKYNGDVVLCDYGLSRPLDMDDLQSAGSFPYAAPEILLGGKSANKETESYSLGRVLFLLWRGDAESYTRPEGVIRAKHFLEFKKDSLFSELKNNDLDENERNELRKVILGLLEENPAKRMSVDEAHARLKTLCEARFEDDNASVGIEIENPYAGSENSSGDTTPRQDVSSVKLTSCPDSSVSDLSVTPTEEKSMPAKHKSGIFSGMSKLFCCCFFGPKKQASTEVSLETTTPGNSI